MKNLYYCLFTLFTFLLSVESYAQAPFPVVIENPSEYSDDELYVAIVGEDLSAVPGVHVWVDMMTGQQYPMNRSYNTMPGPVYEGNRNPDNTALYADVFTKLSDIPDKTVLLHPIQGCRIFISVGEPLYLFFHGATGDPKGYSSPNHTDPTDPNKGIPYELIELTYNQYGFFGNPTRVDSYKIPIGMELFGANGYQQKVGEVATHEYIVNRFLETAPEEFMGCVNLSTGEITAPSKTEPFADGTIGTMPDVGPYVDYMKPYVDAIWTKYSQEDLIFDSGDAGTWKGRVNGETLELESISPAFEGRKGVIVRKPTTQEVFEGKGVLDNVVQDATTDLLVQAQICAAINRHVIDISTPNVGMQDWSREEDYYQEFPYNFYAKFWHDRTISYDGLSYGFAYDDVWGYSPSVHTPEPTLMKISFGGYLNATTDTLTSLVIANPIDSLNLNAFYDFDIIAYNQNGEEMIVYPNWIASNGTIENNGNFTSSVEGTFTITAELDGISASTSLVVYYDSTNVIVPDDGICDGQPESGDYTWELEENGATYTLKFTPNRAGVGNPTVILFYGINQSEGLGGTIVSVDQAYDIPASEGDELFFYYTYSVPEGGERTTMEEMHSVVLGECSSTVVDPPFELDTPLLSINAITQNDALLTWNDVNASNYEIRLNGNSIGNTSAFSFTLNNLTANTVYNVELIASANGVSESTSTNFTTLEEDIDNPTSNCNGNSDNDDYSYEISNDTENPTLTFVPGRSGVGNNIVILYYKVNNADRGGHIIIPNSPYQLTANNADVVDFYFTYSVPEGGERNTATNPHQFEVGGCGPIVPDTEAPSAVSNLQSSEVTYESFTISWNPSTDNRGIDSYEISMNGTIVSTSNTSYTFEGLSELMTYAVSVQAKDISGLYSTSSILNVTTLAEPEIPISNVDCDGEAGFTTSGTMDYYYTVIYENNNATVTFEPIRNGVGSTTRLAIINGAGYHMTDNGDNTYSHTVENTNSVNFYFVYNVPEGGERNGSTQMHSCSNSNARTISLANELKEIELSVYPNPAQQNLHLAIPSELNDGEFNVRIINISTGQIKEERILNNNTSIFDLHNYASGMYIIEVRSEHFHSLKKWIKEK